MFTYTLKVAKQFKQSQLTLLTLAAVDASSYLWEEVIAGIAVIQVVCVCYGISSVHLGFHHVASRCLDACELL